MKAQKVKFINVYNINNGFTPFKKYEKFIFERRVELEPIKDALIFRIIERYEIVNKDLKDFGKHYDRQLAEVAYDNLTIEQKQLATALFNGDIRGYYAECITSNFFITLFVPFHEMKEFLPEVQIKLINECENNKC